MVCQSALSPARAAGEPGSQATPPLPLTSAAGQNLLMRPGTRRADYGSLSQWFETQANLAYCGVASSVMVLNSLALPAPKAENHGNYRFWTQTNVFAAPATTSFVQAAAVARAGMTLEQLHGLLASPGAVVRRFHGDQLSLEQFRRMVRRNLEDPRDRLLANYDRRAVGQTGGGHISPLAAYDPRSDRVLILDVARYRYPAVWVTMADLWRAVASVDRSSGRSRGLLIIQATTQPPETVPPPGPSGNGRHAHARTAESVPAARNP
ncbi:MAG: phytochelatin synthase family protein [Cyanobacteriota bacterium]